MKFEFDEMPVFTRVPIRTKGLPFPIKISRWMFGKVYFELAKNFKFKIDGEQYVIFRGTKTDGVSLPSKIITGLFAIAISFRYYLYAPETIIDFIILPLVVVLMVCWLKLNPMGLMMIPAIIHDEGYGKNKLRVNTRLKVYGLRRKSKYFWDVLMREISIQVNGFPVISYVVFGILTLFGWPAWLKCRLKEKTSKQIKRC